MKSIATRVRWPRNWPACALKQGQPKQALEELQKYFDAKAVSQRLGPYETLAECFQVLKREQDLPAELKRLREHDPDNPYLALFLADRDKDAGKFEEAARLYQHAIDKIPGGQEGQAIASACYRGLAAIGVKQKDAEAVFDVFSRVAARDDDLDVLEDEFESLTSDKPLAQSVGELADKRLAGGRLDYGGALAGAC